MAYLVFNAGSSSLKFALFDPHLRAQVRGIVEWSGENSRATLTVEAWNKKVIHSLGRMDYAQTVDRIFHELVDQQVLSASAPIQAIGQRVVHGGTRFRTPTTIDSSVLKELHRLSEIAPLHNPPAINCINAVNQIIPGVHQIAVFDTAYFQTLLPSQYLYPVPYEWYKRWGIRRFGFHGISHEDCARRAALWYKQKNLCVVSCHLGQGASVTASRGQKAVATSMGFTPLEGVMMGSRSGSVDPGLLLFVQRKHGLSAKKLEAILNRHSGLKGISGISSDMRTLLIEAKRGHERSRLAIDLFVTRIQMMIGAMAATLGGIDVLIFTGGIGFHSAVIREKIIHGLEFLNLSLDQKKNKTIAQDAEISQRGRILVLSADEEAVIARALQTK